MTREEIGRIIRESRMMAGLTQTQVAERLERPQQTIASWESGKSQPDANTLFELFRVLGRSVDEAFGFTKEPFDITRSERVLIEKYRILDPHGKNSVDGLLEAECTRCFAEQNLADYKNRLSQMTEAMERIQQKAQISDERTLDDITKEIRAIQLLFAEAVGMEHDLGKIHDALESSAIAPTGTAQASPAPQKDKLPGAPEAPPKDK